MEKKQLKKRRNKNDKSAGITLIALVVTIALNCYRVAMELMLK